MLCKPCCRRLAFLKAIGPLTVCVLSIALMNIFDWYKPQGAKGKPLIKNIGNIPDGACSGLCTHALPL
jgi:sulfate transporter 4